LFFRKKSLIENTSKELKMVKPGQKKGLQAKRIAIAEAAAHAAFVAGQEARSKSKTRNPLWPWNVRPLSCNLSRPVFDETLWYALQVAKELTGFPNKWLAVIFRTTERTIEKNLNSKPGEGDRTRGNESYNVKQDKISSERDSDDSEDEFFFEARPRIIINLAKLEDPMTGLKAYPSLVLIAREMQRQGYPCCRMTVGRDLRENG
jgi:hypothetical protein